MTLDPRDDRLGRGGIGAVLLEQVIERVERDFGLNTVAADEADNDLVTSATGVAEQPLVDIADLFHVNVAERDPAGVLTLDPGRLDGVEHVQHHAVTHGERERAACRDRDEERESVRVKERSAIRRQAHVLKGRPPIQRRGGRQQPVPGQVGGVQGVRALLMVAGTQGLELPRKPIAQLEQLPLRQQPALFGKQQEHHPHEHGDDGLIDDLAIVGQRVEVASMPRFAGRVREGLHDEFDRLADLRAERLGDLLGRQDRVGEQLRQPVGLSCGQQPGGAQQLNEGVAGALLRHPGEGLENPRGGQGPGGGADQCPPSPIRDEPNRQAARPQHQLHPVDRGAGPRITAQIAQASRRVDHPDERADAVTVPHDAGRLHAHAVIRRVDARRRDHRVSGLPQVAPPEHLTQHHLDPNISGGREPTACRLGIGCQVPPVPGPLEARPGRHERCLSGVFDRRHTAGTHPGQRRDREEGAVGVD